MRVVFIFIFLITGTVFAQDSLVYSDTAIVFNSFVSPLGGLDLPVLDTVSQPQEYDNITEIMFWILLGVFALLVLFWNISRNYSQNLIKSNFNVNHAIQMARSERSIDKIYSYLYLGFFVFVTSLAFFVAVSQITAFELSFNVISIVLLGYVLFELVHIQIAGYLVKSKGLGKIINYSVYSHSLLFLVFFVPLLALMIYAPAFLAHLASNLFLILFIVFLILKEFRFLYLIFQDRMKIPIFYFFLYICTFKILPFVLFVKVIALRITY